MPQLRGSLFLAVAFLLGSDAVTISVYEGCDKSTSKLHQVEEGDCLAVYGNSYRWRVNGDQAEEYALCAQLMPGPTGGYEIGCLIIYLPVD